MSKSFNEKFKGQRGWLKSSRTSPTITLPTSTILNFFRFCQGKLSTDRCLRISGIFLVFAFLTMNFYHPAFAVMQSENYKIKYETISGGQGPERSDNYKMLESIGEVGEGHQRSPNYQVGAGQAFGIMANLPPAPTLVNDNNYYNKLHFTIDPGNNPSDTLFAIAISNDNWVTVEYVQQCENGTCPTRSVLGLEDWQTYTQFGGASGKLATGLEPEKTYKIKVKATSGEFTMTDWGPESAQATTSALELSFSISNNALDFETLSPSAVSTVNYTVTTSTNADYGYSTTIQEDGNLRKTDGADINDVTDGEVSAGHEEYGIRTSGSQGQMNSQDYAITSSVQTIASYSQPITNSVTTVNHKASIDPQTPAGRYLHIVTLITTARF